MAHDTVLQTVTPESLGIPSDGITAFVRTLKERKLREHSVLILRHGKICAEGYGPDFGEEKLHRIYSVSKTFVTAGIGRLIFEGRLKLDDKIVSFFPDMVKEPVEPEIAEMTVRDLLIMSTPFREGTYSFDPSCQNWAETFFNTKPEKIPGCLFHYDTSGTYILNVIVERLTGEPILEYLKKTVFRKIGFSEDAWCIQAPEGNSWCGSGVLCTSRDLAKLAIIFKNKGWYDGEQVLPEDFIEEATSLQIANAIQGRADNCIEGYGYGYFVWRTWRGGYAFFGMGDQIVLTVPDKDLILVTTADNQFSPTARVVLMRAFWDHVVDRCSDGPLPENRAEYEKMVAEITDLPLPMAEGSAHSFLENRIQDKVFRATRPNTMGITEFSFHFEGDEGEFRYTNARGKKVIRFGLGKYVSGTFPEIYSGRRMSTPGDREYRTTACGVFPDEMTFTFRCDIIDWYFGQLTAIFGFKDNECGYRMTTNAENFLQGYYGWGEGVMED